MSQDTLETIRAAVETHRERLMRKARGLHPFTGAEILHRELPPRELLLAPWLPSKGLAMTYAPPGVGKTLFGMNVAYAVASGGTFLKWTAPSPQKVLFVDGEMTLQETQSRYRNIVEMAEKRLPSDDYFRFIASDAEEYGIPDLATPEGQASLEAHIGDAALIVIDNLATLIRSGKENEADSWAPFQEWLIRLKRQGHSVLLVHHAGKGGSQRGTSARLDILDTVIGLKPPAERSFGGAQFTVEFEKNRGFMGADTTPLDVTLDPVSRVWSFREVTSSQPTPTYERIKAELRKGGRTQKDLAAEIGVSEATVSRAKKNMNREDQEDFPF